MKGSRDMVKVCIVGVYFGNLPNYFDLWLKSAKENTSVNFMVFTDSQRDDLPENVCFVRFTLEEMKKLASEKLGFEVCLERPYKCCDFRPAYGVIFEDYLKEFDYWGHCDFDLIWGDLRGFFDRYHLDDYDKFLPLGHLCLYRNTYENNRRFMSDGASASYKTVYTSNSNFAFDETNGVYRIYRKNAFSMFDKRVFADISKIYHRFRLALDDKNYDHQVFCWDNGHIYRYYYDDGKIKRDEFIYIHFKERGALPVVGDCMSNDSFYVTNHGFYPCNTADIDKEEIQKYNPFESADSEKRELKRFTRHERKQRIMAKIDHLFNRKEKLR